MQEPASYFDSLLIGISVAVALLLTFLARRAIKRHSYPLERLHISAHFVHRASSLLPPLLTLIFLHSTIALDIRQQEHLFDRAVHLSVAWFLVRLVMLVVRTRPVALFLSGVIIIGAFLHASGFGNSIHHYLAGMEFEIGTLKLSMLGIVHGVVIFVFMFWLAGVLSRGAENYLRRVSSMSYNARELIVKLFTVMAYSIAIIITLEALGVNLTALAVFGGALGVGIGLGLQRFTANFVSGIAILLERSVKIGDMVEVGTSTGWVRQLHMRYMLLETFDGREIVIPNEELTTSRVTNWTYTNPNARLEIKVRVAYDADPALARRCMLEAARAHPRCLKSPEPLCALREFGDISLNFTLTFWIPDVREGRNGPQSEVMMDILRRFREAGITMPFSPHERRVPGVVISEA